MGRTLERQREMARRLINSGGYETDITFVASNVVIKGLATKHFNSIDSDGLPTISKNAHITVNEQDLIDNNIVVRNLKKEVSLTNTVVSYADSTGVVSSYVISMTMPNETLGHIVCFLTDAK